ncbi:hypothetical protein JAAARDRAFT_50410 [Jaapia argillacea MUCL 33604]|uniref:Uncharacterized protein n=1 Tax=Jaapia argillacea MUCL 33604 TaxID=933084 RepID=A0A067PBJ7_9AGAM|nr:hypothetical protein JAAARDRAFT_50410 [Jaapia argillacea MUCL 33604]
MAHEGLLSAEAVFYWLSCFQVFIIFLPHVHLPSRCSNGLLILFLIIHPLCGCIPGNGLWGYQLILDGWALGLVLEKEEEEKWKKKEKKEEENQKEEEEKRKLEEEEKRKEKEEEEKQREEGDKKKGEIDKDVPMNNFESGIPAEVGSTSEEQMKFLQGLVQEGWYYQFLHLVEKMAAKGLAAALVVGLCLCDLWIIHFCEDQDTLPNDTLKNSKQAFEEAENILATGVRKIMTSIEAQLEGGKLGVPGPSKRPSPGGSGEDDMEKSEIGHAKKQQKGKKNVMEKSDDDDEENQAETSKAGANKPKRTARKTTSGKWKKR